MTVKQKMYKLIEELPESELRAALRFIEYLVERGDDPFLRTLGQATEDDELTTSGEDLESDQAWKEYLDGNAIPADQARRDLLS